jgi:hypothetical protein
MGTVCATALLHRGRPALSASSWDGILRVLRLSSMDPCAVRGRQF